MSLDIVIPTYKRPEKLHRLLESIPATAGERLRDVHPLVWCDNGDLESVEVVKKYNFAQWIASSTQQGPFGIWNIALSCFFTSEFICFIADDAEFINGGVKKILEYCESLSDTDILISLQQDLINRLGGGVGAMSVIGKKFADRFPCRQCYCPLYKAWYGDQELGRYAKEVKKLVVLGDPPLIKHYVNEHNDFPHQLNNEQRVKDRDLNKERQSKGLLWGLR